MKIHIDPVVSARIKAAWDRLPPQQQNRIAPLLSRANQFALVASQTRAAPTSKVPEHTALLAKAALTNDRDGILNNLEQGVVVDVGRGGEIWGTGKYQQLDPGWAGSVASWLEHLVLGKHAFNNTAPESIPIPDDVQIALAGDWGTGDWRTDSNPAPSTDVRHQIAFLTPHLTIHLGDVYYAGTKDEEAQLLVSLWPPGSVGSLTLNSNHEMYSGAIPYFDIALGSRLFSLQQNCSYFVLENSNWVIVGLDSAYYSKADNLYLDGSLQDNGGQTVQLDFLKQQVAKGKKVIILTHHNGLIEDGSAPTELWNQVMSAFPPGNAPAYWYWGHVHAGVVYQLHAPENVLCRCCGHGALPWGQAPEYANNPNVLWYESRSAHDPEIPQRVLNGFAVLHLNGSDVQEVFYDENGGVAWKST